jgi:hypothetical protein
MIESEAGDMIDAREDKNDQSEMPRSWDELIIDGDNEDDLDIFEM